VTQYVVGGVAFAAGTVATGGVLLEATGVTAPAGGVGTSIAVSLQPAVVAASNLSAAEVGLGAAGAGGTALAAGEREATSGSAPAPAIALGLSQTKNHAVGLLDRFAKAVGALTHKQWEQAGLAEEGRSFADFFYTAAKNASQIHFNLSGVEGISEGVPNVGREAL
jgi:hypothetical protein